VIVFTDTQPNVGATEASDFSRMVGEAAGKHVDTTVLAYGLGIGAEVMRGMASLRGANAFGMTKLHDVDDFMADEYPWFTTPIAYDLKVNASLSAGWSIARGLGFPAASDEEQVGLKSSSVFLSKHRGALLVALTPSTSDTLPTGLSGSFALEYTDAATGDLVGDTAPFAYDQAPLDERDQWFSQRGVARTTALGLFTEGMHEAAVSYETGDHTGAVAKMTAAYDRFATDAGALGDDDLPVEVELGAALLQLMQNNAPQGSLYGL